MTDLSLSSLVMRQVLWPGLLFTAEQASFFRHYKRTSTALAKPMTPMTL